MKLLALSVLFILEVMTHSSVAAIKNSANTESQRIYKGAQKAMAADEFEAAKSAFKILNQKYRALVAYSTEEDGPVTFGEIVPKELERIECLQKLRSADKGASRAAEETLRQLVVALIAKDESKLRILVSCDVAEGVPYSEFDYTSQRMAIKHLLGHDGNDGYGFIKAMPPQYKAIGNQSGYHVISNGTDFVGFEIFASKNVPNATYVQRIVWGNPSSD